VFANEKLFSSVFYFVESGVLCTELWWCVFNSFFNCGTMDQFKVHELLCSP
jgi:hypothetical protein